MATETKEMPKKRLPARADRAARETSNKKGELEYGGTAESRSMDGYRRKPRRDTVHRQVCGVQYKEKENIEIGKG